MSTLEAQRGQLARLAEDVNGREATITRLNAELQAARANRRARPPRS